MDALSEFDWNFDQVPDEELVACCYWEYARESAFVRDIRKRCLKEQEAVGPDKMRLHKELQKIQSIGYPSEVFVRGFFFAPDDLHENRHPAAPPITGRFPDPWQKFSKEERAYRAHIDNDVERVPLVPFERGGSSDVKDIAYIMGLRTKDGKRTLGDNQPSAFWDTGKEVTVVSIQWGSFTNDEIANYFRRWIRANRPARFTSPSGKGHKPNDWRAKLTRLAVMRLLARFTALAIVDPRRDSFPSVWVTKQFSGAKWRDVTKWHDARREARKIFHTLFPVLPKEERPLSWEREQPGK